jgi:hypothetical protein
LRSYSGNCGSRDAAGSARLSLIAVLELYLTDFLKCIFPGENAKYRAFCGRKKLKAASVYPPAINQSAVPSKSALRLLIFIFLLDPLPATRTGQDLQINIPGLANKCPLALLGLPPAAARKGGSLWVESRCSRKSNSRSQTGQGRTQFTRIRLPPHLF